MPKRFACDSPGGGHLGLFDEAVGIKVVVRCNVIMRNPTTTLILTAGAGRIEHGARRGAHFQDGG